MFSEQEIKQITDQVLQSCGSDPAEVLVFGTDDSLTRFANNIIHQNVHEKDISVMVRVFKGKRSGIANTNRTDAVGLAAVVEQARRIAQASPEDPHFIELAPPAEYQSVEAYDESTASYSAEQRANQVGVVCRLAAEKNYNASGAFSMGRSLAAIANTQGVFAYHLSTAADFQTVVMGGDASGRAHASNVRVMEIPVESIGREAIRKTEMGQNPRSIEIREYPVVFDSYVTDDLLGMLNYHGMSAQAVHEGRSWINDRQGKQAMSELVTIYDDALDPRGFPSPFDYEGVPKRRVDIVRRGVVQGPVHDRYTAQMAGAESTGHALPANFRAFGPLAGNLFMEPGEASLEDMIRSTEDGIYVTRFWYTRLVHPKDCVITGMTRDGVFKIENGELAYPVKNLRFTQSYVEALNEVQAVGRETVLLKEEYMGGGTRVPAVKIGCFNFTGSTV